jgi:hypothetical protein
MTARHVEVAAFPRRIDTLRGTGRSYFSLVYGVNRADRMVWALQRYGHPNSVACYATL